MGASCRPERQVVTASHAEQRQPWQVIETHSGRVVSQREWLKSLEQYDIVYIGEEHYNPHHIAAALRVLAALRESGISPVLGMEMFGWDGQAALDRYLADETAVRPVFLEAVQWKSNWGGPFENYEPLVNFARTHHVPLHAMNPPKTLIRQVVRLGLAQAREGEEWKQWRMADEEIVDDPAYRARILDQLRRCHGGGAEEDYRTMYEASMVRDEGMAKTLAAAVNEARHSQTAPRSILVSYTGGGHIQYGLPVPKRVARRLNGAIRQATVYLVSFDPSKGEDLADLLREPIADYLWLTPVSGQGPVQRCR